jgi:hypothetical protein
MESRKIKYFLKGPGKKLKVTQKVTDSSKIKVKMARNSFNSFNSEYII